MVTVCDIIRIPLAQPIRKWHENSHLCKIRFIGYLPPARFPHVTYVHDGKRADVIYPSNSNFIVPDFETMSVNTDMLLRDKSLIYGVRLQSTIPHQ